MSADDNIDLFNWRPDFSQSRFNGPVYDPELDQERLSKQIGRVYSAMLDNDWHTLTELEIITADPQASISAQLRHLRKERFGGYTIEKRRRGDETSGLWEYRLLPPNEHQKDYL